MNEDTLIDLGVPTATPSIIKVIGVGGGGGNAVNYMYREGIHDVNFVICNTDSKALQDSPIPVRLQLGSEGLGAGNRPERAKNAAEESIESIRNMLNDGTKMVFITAGMGGGTGTGAAPVIAREAKAMDILTVGIVTIPFLFEGARKIDQALDGVEEIAKHVDALLVINNERLREIYPDLNVLSAFERADNTLSVAARSIAEIITMHGVINLDFRDVCTVLKDGGVAIMSTGYGEGENRVTAAIQDALHSPLLNSNDIFNSKKVLLSISFCAQHEGDTLMMEEMNEVHEFMGQFREDVETKFGLSVDSSLGKKVKITILATGFGITNVPGIKEKLDLEEQERLRELEEKAEENDIRRELFYGPNDSKGTSKKRPKVYLFGIEDLDNEEIISLVEITPTYKRTKEQLNDIKAKVEGAMVIEPETSAIDMSSPISFT
ncbi:MAG: cell division protein FtsZ [Bacteroidaceae bacterium]|jgi:cell division protein FtsZ|nr:cell division protein FtsZ [Bacteroidaceae bacterium]